MPGRSFSTHTDDPETVDALHEGVPSWMKSSLDAWLRGHLTHPNRGTREDLIQALERLLRVNLSNDEHGIDLLYRVLELMDDDPELKLDVVQGILQLEGTPYSGTDELEQILIQSGSKWKVVSDEGTGKYSLQERVDDTVTHTLGDLAQADTNASRYMVQAWNEAFGRNPNPSDAYSKAIKALEAASWPVVTPDNERATLGTIIKELKDHPELFSVAIHETSAGAGIEAIRQEMALIWKGQTDRHATANPIPPSQEAAEQALFSVLALCQQFSRGLIRRS